MDFKPQNAKSVKTLLEAADHCSDPVMEIKYDGWRLIAIVEDEGPRLWSRSAKEYTGRVPEIEAELAKLPVGTILDGEIVDLETHDYISVTNVFGKSKNLATDEQRAKLTYVAFDLLSLGHESVATKPLKQRREALVDLIIEANLSDDWIQWSRWWPVDEEVLENWYEAGYEGAIVKDRVMPYMKGKRGHGWFKIKGTEETDAIVTELPHNGKGKNTGLVGHMIVSQYDGDKLVPIASVNAPDDATRKDMTQNPEKYLGRILTVKHYGKIVDGLRHPNFIKWRPDKPAEDCVVN